MKLYTHKVLNLYNNIVYLYVRFNFKFNNKEYFLLVIYNMFSNYLLTEKPSSSLQQGADYNKKIKSYKPVGIEGFEGQQSDNNKKLDLLKTEFDQTLAQYSAAYQQYIKDFMNHQDSPTIKYANSLVSTLNGEKYMINKYGYLRKFATDAAYSNRDSTCNGQNLILDSATLAQIPVGINIVEKEVCGLEGQMIQDKQSNNISWVDEKGQRHMKDDSVPIPQGCPTNLIGVPHDGYLATGTAVIGDYFTKSSTCNTSALNDDIHPTLVALNDKLVSLSTQILGITSKLRGVSNSYDEASRKTDATIKNQIAELKRQKEYLHNIMEQTATLDATLADNMAVVRANSLKYLFIAGGTAVVIAYLLKNMVTN